MPKFTFSFWKFWSLTGQQPSERSEQFGLGCRDSLVDLSMPSILHPQVRLPAHHLCFHQFIKLSNVEKTKINKKRPGLALFKNMWWNVFTYLASLATALIPEAQQPEIRNLIDRDMLLDANLSPSKLYYSLFNLSLCLSVILSLACLLIYSSGCMYFSSYLSLTHTYEMPLS